MNDRQFANVCVSLSELNSKLIETETVICEHVRDKIHFISNETAEISESIRDLRKIAIEKYFEDNPEMKESDKNGQTIKKKSV